MLEILNTYQLDFMLFLSGCCAASAFFEMMNRTTERYRQQLLFAMQVSAMFLLLFDREAYLYRGDVSRLGYWMVRISNFMVFFLTLILQYMFTLYVKDLYTKEGKLDTPPRRIRLAQALILAGIVLLVISQFTGLYYTFDDTNHYQRSPANVISFLIPLAVLCILLSIILQNYRHLPRKISRALLLFTTGPILASLLQTFSYGLSLTNIASVALVLLLYIIDMVETNAKVDRTNRLELEYYEAEQKSMQRLFDETAKALVSAIDAKDEYTRGHSTRVAENARKLAELDGKSEKECQEIYYAGLLHDVGKIGIPLEILNKDGKLTEEEQEEVRQHPLVGNQILSSISEYPYLSTGAYYHHEWYNGDGYPSGLKGTEIPEMARIIAVADAYEVMTSPKVYRDPLPTERVREELVKGSGTQFDPKYVSLMLHIIDTGGSYTDPEQAREQRLAAIRELHFDEYRSTTMEGIELTPNVWEIHLECTQDEDFTLYECAPALILFDSLDGRVHTDEKGIRELNYLEYGEIWLDGHTVCTEARKMRVTDLPEKENIRTAPSGETRIYDLEAVKYKDHVLIRIHGLEHSFEVITALPDSTRFAYLSISGEHCRMSGIRLNRSDMMIKDGFIPRIAEEISFLDRMEGDLPNVQVDGYRTDATEGIPIEDGMQILFHTLSLPSARTVWHCPLITIFYSSDGTVKSEDYREYALICPNGEKRGDDDNAVNELTVEKAGDFAGWENWIECNKKGLECVVSFKRKKNRITVTMETLGISVKNVTIISDGTTELYAALTGDQCAFTDIRIRHKYPV